MHSFVQCIGLSFTFTLVACSSSPPPPVPSGATQGALADKGPAPGAEGCFDETLDACEDISVVKQIAADKCGVPGLTLADFAVGASCGGTKVQGVKFTCCRAETETCDSYPIPAKICGDDGAVKDYAVQACGERSPGVSFVDGDGCNPKSSIECCTATSPPPQPPPPSK